MKQRFKTSGQMDYEFEELSLDDGDNLYNGSALIVYEYEPSDPDVGIFSAGFGWHVDDITLEIGGHKIAIDWKRNQSLFDDIEKAIIKQYGDHISSKVESHAEL
jgi:hypothetical protein